MHSDSYFYIGKSHNVCQDYAISGKTPSGKAYAIVSDGCSGSLHTDFGSRFMAKSLQYAVEQDKKPDAGLFTVAAAMGQQMASSCNMPYECLDATLLCAVESESAGRPGVWVGAAGDGVIVARHRGRSHYDVHRIDFYVGYPAYASYMIDCVRMMQYIDQTDGGLASIQVRKEEDGTSERLQHVFYSKQLEWFRPYITFFDKEKYDFVALMSDGAQSFQEERASETSKILAPIELEDVLPKALDFKGSMKGEFVVRRAKSFLSKTCPENHWVHHDDFSLAVVTMD